MSNAAERDAIEESELVEPLTEFFKGSSFTIRSFTAQPLDYGIMNPVTHGLHRVAGTAIVGGEGRPFAMIRKAMGLHAPNGSDISFEMSDDPRHWNYWKRELLAYRSEYVPQANATLRAPACYASSTPDDQHAVIWLEDLVTRPAEFWPIDRVALAAKHLGQWQSRFVGSNYPDVPWLSENWLRVLLPTRLRAEVDLIDNDENWQHPLVQELFDPALRPRIVELWNQREILLRGLDKLPQTLTHYDFRMPNLFDGADPSETVVLDWQFAGKGAIGQDLVSLVIDNTFMNYVPPENLRELEAMSYASYLDGLRSGGWQGNEIDVWMAYAATAGLRFGLACGWLVLLATQPDKAAEQEARYERPIAEILKDRLVAVDRSLELGYEALGHFSVNDANKSRSARRIEQPSQNPHKRFLVKTPDEPLDICRYRHMMSYMARAPTTADAFNAVAESSRRDLLDAIGDGEVTVNELVDQLGLSQPQVSKHLGVLRAVGLVLVRIDGRHRWYRVNGPALQPIHQWVSSFERTWNVRLDRLDDLLVELKSQEESP